jgi:hypothetical protein
MSVIVSETRTIHVKPALAIAFGLAVIALLGTPLGPLGTFWRPSPDVAVPATTSVQYILFLVLNIAESLAFGLGIVFLFFGYPIVRAVSPASLGLTRAAHLAITWLLGNWWMHDSLHTHIGMELNGLLGIEYGFHLTLMISGVILAVFFLTIMRQEKAMSG